MTSKQRVVIFTFMIAVGALASAGAALGQQAMELFSIQNRQQATILFTVNVPVSTTATIPISITAVIDFESATIIENSDVVSSSADITISDLSAGELVVVGAVIETSEPFVDIVVPTATPTATPTVTPTSSPGSAVTQRDSNLRSGPGTTYDVSGFLAAGATITVVGRNQAGDWYLLDTGQWIAAFLVEGELAAVPVATPAPTATPTPEPTPTPLPSPTPTLSLTELLELDEGEVKQVAVELDYDSLARNTEGHVGKVIYQRGEILQYMEIDEDPITAVMRVDVGDFNIVFVDYLGEERLLEGDTIDMWSMVFGRRTYEAVLGNAVTLPELIALHVERVE